MARSDTGFGTTVAFGTSAFAAYITNVSWSSMERESIDTTHLASTGNFKTFMGGDLIDPGELELEIQHDPALTPVTALTTPSETVTVTWPTHPDDTNPATWACSGFMTSYEAEAPMDDLMTGSCTVKFTGTPTITPSTS